MFGIFKETFGVATRISTRALFSYTLITNSVESNYQVKLCFKPWLYFFFMLPLWIILDHQLARRLKTILQTKVSIWEKKDPMSYHYHCHTDLCSVEEKGDWYSPAQPDDLGNQWGFTNRAGMEPSLHKSLAPYWGKEGRFSATIFPV